VVSGLSRGSRVHRGGETKVLKSEGGRARISRAEEEGEWVQEKNQWWKFVVEGKICPLTNGES